MAAPGIQKQLLSNAGASTGSAVSFPGGLMVVSMEGTVTSVAMQMQTPNGAWVPIAALAFSAAGVLSAWLPAGNYRAVVTTGTAVYAYMYRAAM